MGGSITPYLYKFETSGLLRYVSRMKLHPSQIFIDWLTIREDHLEHHTPVHGGEKLVTDEIGALVSKISLPHRFAFEKGTSVGVKSDGYTVEISGNIAALGLLHNHHGKDLDWCKRRANMILREYGLPEFTDKARFTRIDVTTNLTAGNPEKRDQYLRWLQTQGHPTLKTKSTAGLNTYWGRDATKASKSRTTLVYDKARHLNEVVIPELPKPDRPGVKRLAKALDKNGYIRWESRLKGYLRTSKLNWKKATHDRVASVLQKEITAMHKAIEVADLDGIPKKYIPTLCAWLQGYDPRKLMSRTTFWRHRKALKTYGWDIGENGPVSIRAKQKPIMITLQPRS